MNLTLFCRNSLLTIISYTKISNDWYPNSRTRVKKPPRKMQTKNNTTNYLLTEFRARYYQVSSLRTEVAQAITISSRYESDVGLEYLYLGRHGKSEKHRFLLQFDLARIPTRAKVLSATLQLFLVNAGNKEDNLQHTLEVYPITSTAWHESNTTSVVPWNKDFLGINEDVDKSRY